MKFSNFAFEKKSLYNARASFCNEKTHTLINNSNILLFIVVSWLSVFTLKFLYIKYNTSEYQKGGPVSVYINSQEGGGRKPYCHFLILEVT